MKPRLIAFMATLLAATPAVAANSPIEFSGVLTADGKTHVALTDAQSGTTTWVETGGFYNGFTVARYDSENEAVFLTRNGEEMRLRLAAPKVAEAGRRTLGATLNRPSPPAPPVSPAPSPTPSATQTPAASETRDTALSGAAPATPPSAPPLPSATPPAAAAATTTPAPAPTPTTTPPASSPTTPAAPTGNSAVANTIPAADNPVSTPPAGSTEITPTPTGRLLAGPSYRVQAGDTVESIALTHGVSTQQIRQLNPALNSTSLQTGETIRIRPE
jgi:LysM repeat protein